MMDMTDYLAARRLGLKEYAHYISQGRNGYLPFLDGVLKNIDIVSELDIGLVDVPLKKVKGTYTYLRSISFARNYMPLMEPDSEFAIKWQNVCKIQVNEGLRDPIKVYEYLNWFYVVEGNKRVSVLKYMDIYSYHGTVTRLVPKYDENNKDIRLYYEFMDFYKKTKINQIWFSKEKSFSELWEIIKDYKPSSRLASEDARFNYFVSAVYGVFRKVFYSLGGDKLPVTTGDAFLDFLKIHGISDSIDEDELKTIMKRYLVEMEYHASNQVVEVQTSPQLKQESTLIGRLTQRRTDRLKIGFGHVKDEKTSSWIYSHELGRMHLEHVLGRSIDTVSLKNLPESIDAAPSLQKLIDEGCHVIFTTSPSLLTASLKVAMENPEVNILNCSAMHSFKHVNTYFGRIHEPRFLSGIVAGILTKTNKLGYLAPFPVSDVISGINAFTLGARMVNPEVSVYVEWMLTWDFQEVTQRLTKSMAAQGVDIISHHNTLANRQFSREYGVYTIAQNAEGDYVPDKYLAVPVWNWGIFYEKYIRSLLVGGIKMGVDTTASGRIRNYWWGLDSGLLDFFYAKSHVPLEARKLIELIKTAITSQSFKVFTGPIFDMNKQLMVEEGEEVDHEALLTMDWLVDGVICEIPKEQGVSSVNELATGKIAGSGT